MPRLVRCSLIQAHCDASPDLPLPQLKRVMIDKHLEYIRQAAEAGAQIVCLQELFSGPYFCAEQQIRWYDFTEPVPGGATIARMQEAARQYNLALIVPVYEREQEGVYYNTAAVLGSDGSYLGNIVRPIFRTLLRAFGRSFTSGRATWVIPFSTWAWRASAFTSAMTATFRKARGRWG